MSPAQQRTYLQQLQQKQSSLMNQLAGFGVTEIARLSKGYNALIVSIEPSQIKRIQALSGVASVRQSINYSLSLSTVVPYIGAASVHTAGVTGAGVRVAVLDSGIDYTHKNLGGAGTVAAYTAAYGANEAAPQNKTRDGLFPTAKVVEGFDFVGEAWPVSARTEDPDPIDREGHGTHVADIVAGRSNDGTHKGVAFNASLLAVKVCSAVATTCNGIALLKGIDYSLDPNRDGDVSDAVDVINMSLGSDFGQREDDLSLMATIATQFGVTVVASAGNGGNIPFISGSPATSPAIISVAETQVPTATNYGLTITAPSIIAGTYRNTATLDFAPIGSGFTNTPIVFVGQGCPADDGTTADPYLANPSGKVALIDRGTCSVSLKIDRAAKAGAVGVLIGLIAPSDAVSFSFGGGTDFVPTLVITQPVSSAIKGQLAAAQTVRGSVSNATILPLVGSVVNTSSRGPGYSYGSLKPDVAAPGESVSANVGSGTGQSAFGGTSGAAPVVAGSAALILQACPLCTPLEVKARLMNTAEINILTNPAIAPGVLAPVTRIGAGEVRVQRAIAAKTAAWDAGDPESVSLSLGLLRINAAKSLQKKVLVRNYESRSRTYSISSAFRFANDEASGALSISAPASVTVPANGTATFVMGFNLTPTALPTWTLNGGSNGGNGTLLNGPEFDGFVTLTDATDTIRLPWHVLPHKAARVQSSTTALALGGAPKNLQLTNIGGAVAGRFDLFSLVATSPKIPESELPQVGDSYAVIDLRAVGARAVVDSGEFLLQFAVNTYGKRSHPTYPAEFDIYVDTNGDLVEDYVIFNIDEGNLQGLNPTGRNLVAVAALSGPTAGFASAYFFTDTDLDTSNLILTVPMAALGITPATKLTFGVYAFDIYFTGALTDSVNGIVYTPATPKFAASPVFGSVPAGGATAITVQAVPGGTAASPSQTGLFFLYKDAISEKEAELVTVTP